MIYWLFIYIISFVLFSDIRTIFMSPKLDDWFPVSADGGIHDIHITAFVSTIDSLLTASQSHALSHYSLDTYFPGIITPMSPILQKYPM
jgi:hypothetical protein